MKQFNILVICLVFLLYKQSAVAQNPAWSLAPKFLYQSLTSLPTSLSGYNNEISATASNMQLDAQGEISFFIVGSAVYKKNGDLIGYLQNYNRSYYVTGESEIVVMPDPNSCSRYYIFASGKDGASDPFNNPGVSNKFPYYAIVDVSTNTLVQDANGNTAFFMPDLIPNGVTAFQSNSPRVSGVTFAASKLITSNNSRFVFVSNNFNKIFRFKVTSSGITYDGDITMLSSGSNYGSYRSEMELVNLSNGNYRIATMIEYVTSNNFEDSKVFTAELNPQGNAISQTMIEFPRNTNSNIVLRIKGLEFTTGGDKLFITHTQGSIHTNPIEYYDFATSQILVPNIPLSEALDFQWSQIEMGGRGLYFATSNRLALYNPNSGTWSNNSVPFGSFVYKPNNGVYDITPSSTDMEKLYTLPDQIDGMDYNAHFYANTQCCIANQWFSKDAFTATASATWQPGANPFGNTYDTVYIKTLLTIPAGKNITIKNMFFKFAPDAKVIVDRGNALYAGGKLTLDGTTFSADTRCNSANMWLGVEVYGDPTKVQLPEASSKQGWFQMINNSVVEDCYNGVTAAKMVLDYVFFIPFYKPDNNYTGGVIRATNSKFRNNFKDVQLFNYKPPTGSGNASNFTRSEFFTDGFLNYQNLMPNTHVYLENVEGISFMGCKFENRTPALFAVANRGQGINSKNANYSVFAPYLGGGINNNSNYIYTSFKELTYGVYAIAGEGTRTFQIDRANFVNTMYGTFLQGINLAEIVRSNFELLRTKTPNPIGENYGIYLDACNQYKIEGNTFTEFNDPQISGHGNTTGVIVNNSGVNSNQIYRNQFHDLNVGIRAQGNNGSNSMYGDNNPTNTGLQIKCNRFYNSMFKADIGVTTGRIDYQQGYCLPANNPNAQKSLAGNRFSHSTFTSDNDISVNSGALGFKYTHHADYSTTPIYKSSVVTTQSCNGILLNESQACPSSFAGIIIILSPFELGQKLDSLQQLITENKNQLQAAELNNLSSAKKGVNNQESEVNSDLSNRIKYLEIERSNLINDQLRAVLFDTTISNKDERVNELVSQQKDVFAYRPIPTYLKNIPENISSEFDYYLATFLDSLPLAVVEPLYGNGQDVFAVETAETINYLSIYPNPTTTVTSTTIALQNVSNEDVPSYSVEIYDLSMYGKQWVKQYFTASQTTLNIPNNVLKAGFYVVKLFQNEELIEMKTLRVD